MTKNPLKDCDRAKCKQQAKLMRFLSEYARELYPDVYNLQLKVEAGSKADVNLGRLCNAVQRLHQEASNIAECLADIASQSPRLF